MNSTPQTAPSHVAILVPSVRKAAAFLGGLGFRAGQEEEFPGEGTREVYLEFGRPNALLLLEAIGPGPYQRALEKRGPGLHHLAVETLNRDEFLSTALRAGWALHAASTETIPACGTGWLFAKGFPALLEVQESPDLLTGVPFVNQVHLPMEAAAGENLLAGAGLTGIVRGGASAFHLVLGEGKKVFLEDLL